MHRPKDSIRCCIVDDRAIFMDVARNRYFALAPRSDELFRSLVNNTISVQHPIFAEPGNADIVDLANSIVSLPSGFPDAAADLGEIRFAAGITRILWVALVIAVAKLVLKVVPFHRIVSHLEAIHRKDVVGGAPQMWCAQTCVAFRGAELLFQRQNNCLPRSLAFRWLCYRRGYRARLVIGIRIRPFAAHSWVQDGDVVLNDAKEAVRPYRPILVL